MFDSPGIGTATLSRYFKRVRLFETDGGQTAEKYDERLHSRSNCDISRKPNADPQVGRWHDLPLQRRSRITDNQRFRSRAISAFPFRLVTRGGAAR
jgi:hypothetical protein